MMKLRRGEAARQDAIIDVGSHLIAGRYGGIRGDWGEGSSPTMSVPKLPSTLPEIQSGADDGIKASDSLYNSYLGRLPRELRDEIYKHYFTTRDGYRIDPTTNTLRASDGSPINLSLRLTCYAIAKDTEGLALQYNTIHATTTKDKRFARAAYISWRATRREFLVDQRVLTQRSNYITPSIADEILDGFPQYREALEEMISNHTGRFGPNHLRYIPPVAIEAWSTEQKFVSRAAKIMRERLELPGTLFSDLCRLYDSMLSDTDRERQTPCWEFKDDANAPEMYFRRSDGGPLMDEDISSSCFSAAAVALRFWNALELDTRKHIRQFEIDEDRRSEFFPMCHAEGFIPLWRENPKLHINRRVSLGTIIEEAKRPDSSNWCHHHAHHADSRCCKISKPEMKADSRTELKTFWDWIAEVKALNASFDIPKEAFSLAFYSEASPEDTKEVFDVMREAAAWQIALDAIAKSDTTSSINALGFDYRNYPWDPRGLAWRALQEISRGCSMVKCDFDMGQSVDPKDLYDGSGGWSHERWAKHCAVHDSSSWLPEAEVSSPTIFCIS